MNALLKAYEFLHNFGLAPLFALFCLFVIWRLLIVLLDEDRASVFRARLYKVAFCLTKRTEQEKKYIANDVRGRLNLARRKLIPNDAPAAVVDVAWVDVRSGQAEDLREGEFIVRLDPSNHQDKNIAVLAAAVVKRTLLVGLRHSVEQPLQTAIDLNTVRILLNQVGNRAALDWFLANEYEPARQKDNATNHRNEQIIALDERGLFTRILLLELRDFARRIYGRAPRPFMAGEIEGLVDFLHRIATKGLGQGVPLRFHRAYIRISVILVAKTDTLLRSIQPYIYAMRESLAQQAYSIYVIAFDKEWLGDIDLEAHKQFEQQVERLRSALEEESEATKEFDLEYSCLDQQGRRRKARCIRFLVPE
jgi:hypothetical protein